jgi:hypothetical protein
VKPSSKPNVADGDWVHVLWDGDGLGARIARAALTPAELLVRRDHGDSSVAVLVRHPRHARDVDPGAQRRQSHCGRNRQGHR